jgi:hypothetical protein
MDELLSHFWSDDISSMTEVLESFNPDNSGPFDGRDEEVEPEILSFLEEQQGETADGGNEDDPELNEPDDVPEDINDAFPHSEYLLLVSVGNYGRILGSSLERFAAFEISGRERLSVEINGDGGEQQSLSQWSDPVTGIGGYFADRLINQKPGGLVK